MAWGGSFTCNGQVTITRSSAYYNIDLNATNSSVSNSICRNLRLNTTNTSATNCIIRDDINSASNSTVTNCIFTIAAGNGWNTNSGSFTYCMAVGSSSLPAGTGNIQGQLISNVFTQTGGDGERDRFWQLKAGSPALASGLGGVDMGIFGGSAPYVLGGVPGIPRMTRFNAPTTATGLTAVTIEVQAEAFAE
jgi:hypothetical protein